MKRRDKKKMVVIHRKALPTQFSVGSRKDYGYLSFQVS
jgi:hypothetical protein